jgi:hypothetical protein
MADSSAVFEIGSSDGRAKVFTSDPLASVDAPEPYECVGKFVYNYFTPSEKTEYSGGTGFVTRTFLDENASDFNGKKPRFITLSFKKPPADFEAATTSDISAFLEGSSLFNLIEQGFVHVEDSITSTKYQRLQITAAGTNLRSVTAVSGSSSYVGPDGGSEQLSNPELARTVAKSIAGVRGTLPADLSTSIAAAESDAEISRTIIKYINGSGQALQKIKYYGSSDQSIREATADIITDRQETLAINNLVIDSVIKASACNINHLLISEISQYLSTSGNIQSSARAEFSSLGINPDAFEIAITPFYTDDATATSYRSVLLGYIVEKIEVGVRGEVIEHPTIILVGCNVTTLQDLFVNYGSMYKYRVRAVFMREAPVTLEESGSKGRAKFLVASSGESAEAFVVCVDDVPPPEPEDFRITYDYQRSAMRLTWSLPVNPQIDIKYFQVFRRESINQAFRLQRVIDFDNSTVKDLPRESYPDSIVRKSSLPMCFFVDPVEKEKEYIYAVCCVDAHGLSSSYSMQISAIFKRSRNAILTAIVSRSGAPKTYPNLYLNEDTFADAVNVTGARRMTTFFDPELLTVVHPDGAKEQLTEKAKFTISLINEDSGLADSVVIQSANLERSSIDAYLSASIVTDPTTTQPSDPATDTVDMVSFRADSFF